MEKLIELLNEYEPSAERKQDGDLIVRSWYTDGYELFDAYIISKQFGFIKRLVKNNKIDNSKLSMESDMGFGNKYEREESLLMLLSISENPIEDLISYLK